MKVIDVNKQVRLSLLKTVELVLSGVKFRLFRAAVTVVIIALAVAFLMTMLSESVIARNVAVAINKQTGPRRLLVYWVSRLTQPIQPAELTKELASVAPGDERWAELQGWSKLDDEKMHALVDVARQQLIYDAYFDGLADGDLRAIVGRARGEEIYSYLASPEALEQFKRQLPSVGKEFPGGTDTFESFIEDWGRTQDDRAAILAGHSEATRLFHQNVLGNVPPHLYLAGADESLLETITALGFHLTADELAIVSRQAGLTADADQISSMLKAPSLRNALTSKLKKESATDVGPQELFSFLQSDSGTKWFFDELGRIKDKIRDYLEVAGASKEIPEEEVAQLEASRALVFGFDLPAETVKEVASASLRGRHLAEVEAKVAQTAGLGWFGFSSKTLALIIVSFLVCMVGIVNAMLMSVAERFREIATMKCLGATDGFIMVNFMLESCVQGLAGGVVGAVLGLILGVIRSWWMYGWIAITNVPLLPVLASSSISFVLGVILSVLAAVYPALVAARLAPMEAMRIE